MRRDTLRSNRNFVLLRALLAGGLVATALALPAAPAPAAPPKVAVGYCTMELEKAKAAGFDYVELGVRNFAKMSDEEWAKFVERHKAAGISTPVANTFLPAEIKIVGPDADKDRDKNLEYAQKAFDRAKQLGIKTVVFGSGASRKVPDGFSKDDAWKQLVAFAKLIAPEAKKRGIVLAVEPLQKGETNTINTAAEGLKWVEEVNHPNFQLMVDFYHLSLEKEDPAILVKAAKHIKHFHIANPNGRLFPQNSDEYDYSGFFANMKKMGFKGGISVEAKTGNFDEQAPKAIAFLRGAVDKGVKAPVPGAAPPKAAAAPAPVPAGAAAAAAPAPAGAKPAAATTATK
jgi:D-psicose/D-tagatose/L-ribulose 3-epimerase